MIETQPTTTPPPDSTAQRVVMIDPLEQAARDLFAAALPEEGWQLEYPADAGDAALAELVRGAAAIVTRRRFVGPDLLAAAGPGLRLVQVQGHLPDRVDLAAARAAGVQVAVMPSKGCIAVAEHAMALMLAFARKIVPGHTGVVRGAYRERGLTPARTSERVIAFNWLGFADVAELNGRTLGIIGLGEIGQEVARRARAFAMRVRYYTRRPLAARFERMLGVERAPLDDLLREADYLTLHVPHSAETDRFLDSGRIALLKPTACVVNTSRGGVIDEAALARALRDRRIAGAALDVFVEEPLPADHPFIGLDNVLLTPHVGGGSGGGQRLHARETMENVARALRGEALRHRIDVDHQP